MWYIGRQNGFPGGKQTAENRPLKNKLLANQRNDFFGQYVNLDDWPKTESITAELLKLENLELTFDVNCVQFSSFHELMDNNDYIFRRGQL